MMDSRELAEKMRLLCICGDLAGTAVLEKLERLIEAGVTAVQLRVKGADGRELYLSAVLMARFCGERGVLFFVNDRLDVAMASGADGVHLGARDIPVTAARRAGPPGLIIGVTARDAETAAAAQLDGADYIGSGAAFSSSTKLDARIIGPEGIAKTAASVSIPTVGISGINSGNMSSLSGCGLAGVAVSAALAGDAGAAEAKKLRDLIEGGILS